MLSQNCNRKVAVAVAAAAVEAASLAGDHGVARHRVALACFTAQHCRATSTCFVLCIALFVQASRKFSIIVTIHVITGIALILAKCGLCWRRQF